MEQPLILRSVVSSPVRRGRSPRRHGVTLLELLVATTLMLLIMGLLIYHVFGPVTEAVSNSRALLERSANNRVAVSVLQNDLSMATAPMSPPLTPEERRGYFEYIEGPVGPRVRTIDVAFDSMAGPEVSLRKNDTTVGDNDDILMFTVGGVDAHFSGHGGSGNEVIESSEAEIIYFVRGRTLYRRVLLIVPREELEFRMEGNYAILSGWGFYNEYDVSVALNNLGYIEANSLQDLTRPERRFAHRPSTNNPSFPNTPRLNLNDNQANPEWGILGMPTLRECSHANWRAGGVLPTVSVSLGYYGGDDGLDSNGNPVAFPDGTPLNRVDYWRNPHPYNGLDAASGTLTDYQGPRVTEDILMTDVIGFDVKIWDPLAPVYSLDGSAGDIAVYPGDPGYARALRSGTRISQGAYVDLGYGLNSDIENEALSIFSGHPHPDSGLYTASATGPIRNRIAVYDTWSTHYENDGIGNDYATNGLDDDTTPLLDENGNGNKNDDGNGLVDDAAERETFAPYEEPVSGIKITIRYFERNSKQVRETSVYHSFVPD